MGLTIGDIVMLIRSVLVLTCNYCKLTMNNIYDEETETIIENNDFKLFFGF